MNVAGNWAGKVYGTNTGNLFIKIQQDENCLEGVARLMDDVFGLVVYKFKGEANDNIKLTLTPTQHPPGVEVSTTIVDASLNEKGELIGEWESELGTGGTFRAFPHANESVPTDVVDAPEQVFNRTIPIGSVRLYGEDIEKLLDAVKKDFVQGRLLVSYDCGGNRITRYAEDFLKESREFGKLRFFMINIQEPESHGINRSVTVELTESHGSIIRVSGPNETWVIGKAESLRKNISKYQRNIVTNYRKHGLGFNFILFLLMIVAAPEIEGWWNRFSFVVGVTILLSLLLLAHRKFIPNTVINATELSVGFFKRTGPSILSWLMAIVGALAAGLLLHILTNGPSSP